VLKLYPETLQWKMRKEVFVSGLLQGKIDVPVPRILLSDDAQSLVALSFNLMSRLDGDVLLGREPPLTPTEVSSVYQQMGRILRAFHRIPMTAFGYVGTDGVVNAHATNRSYMTFQFDRKLTELVERGGDPALAGRLRAFAGARKHLLDGCA